MIVSLSPEPISYEKEILVNNMQSIIFVFDMILLYRLIYSNYKGVKLMLEI